MRGLPALACITALLLGASAWSQETSTGQGPESGSTDAMPASDPLPDDVALLQPGRSPLLREGTQLVDVRGWMVRDEQSSLWRFIIDEDNESAPGYTLTLLPSAVLQEMMELRRIADETRLAFEVSGRVLVYRGRSYFLPTHAPRIIDQAPTPGDAVASEPDAGEDSTPPEDDSVRSIMRDLEAAVGPVARSAGPTAAARGDASAPRVEGSMIVARRGRLTRTAAGAWKFVFDADASGLSDPPMTVLPCLLLERMERYARTRGGTAPMIVSGRVLAFNGRNYLYPSVFRMPRERSHLQP